jgi:hypothetical protein
MPGHGSIAVLMQDPGGTLVRDLQSITAQVRDAIVWTR